MLLSHSVFRTEVNAGVHAIYFTHARHTTLSIQEMWSGLEQALTDAANAWLWPDEFSVHEQESLPLSEGGYFHTTYRMTDPETGKTTQYRYRYQLVRWRPAQHLFEYRAQQDHPFPGGGGVVTLEVAEDGGTLFTWDGVYEHNGNRAGAAEVFSWYFPTFFRRVDRNIKDRIAAGG